MRLNFLHPEFRPGLNSTVRDGVRSVVPGESVELFETGASSPVATGVVQEVRIVTAGHVTDEYLKYQHDAGTRDTLGLWDWMESAYGRPFKQTDVVSIIYFWLGSREPGQVCDGFGFFTEDCPRSCLPTVAEACEAVASNRD